MNLLQKIVYYCELLWKKFMAFISREKQILEGEVKAIKDKVHSLSPSSIKKRVVYEASRFFVVALCLRGLRWMADNNKCPEILDTKEYVTLPYENCFLPNGGVKIIRGAYDIGRQLFSRIFFNSDKIVTRFNMFGFVW